MINGSNNSLNLLNERHALLIRVLEPEPIA
jgi:hypothetical protein